MLPVFSRIFLFIEKIILKSEKKYVRIFISVFPHFRGNQCGEIKG